MMAYRPRCCGSLASVRIYESSIYIFFFKDGKATDASPSLKKNVRRSTLASLKTSSTVGYQRTNVDTVVHQVNILCCLQ